MTEPPLDRRRHLLNVSEDRTRRLLCASAERNGAHVFSKIRIADALTIDHSGLENDLYGFALRGHLDFVVSDSTFLPQFAVEFDGPHHMTDAKAIANDRRKNVICDRLGLPLARVGNEHLFHRARGLDYLTWLTEMYFSFRALVDAQESGSLPMDEPLDPMMFMTHPHFPGHFPLFISKEARLRLLDLAREGFIRNPVPLLISGVGCNDDRTTCLTSISLSAGGHLVTESSIYLDGFGVSPSEAASEIATSELAHLADGVRKDGAHVVDSETLRARIIAFIRERRGNCEIHEGGSDLDFTLSYSWRGGMSSWAIGGLNGEPEVVIPRK